MHKKVAVIIGAGPAGLTAAYELLAHTDIKPIVIEQSDLNGVGGISQTLNYKGNRMDIGGHRFFSRSEQVMNWWGKILPLESKPVSNMYNKFFTKTVNKNHTDDCFLVRSRLSRIFYDKKFYDYPISLSMQTIKNLGVKKMVKAGASFLFSLIHKRKENNLEDFYINRFGNELYKTFFKDYTHKVWGVEVKDIPADWGAQRVKGLSVASVLLNAFKKIFKGKNIKAQETSLIEYFLYPKLGPGSLWQKVLTNVKNQGADVHFNSKVVKIKTRDNKVKSVTLSNGKTIKCDYCFSSMPINELINSFDDVSEKIKTIANGLMFRDFITVGLLVDTDGFDLKDNWIYIQDPNVIVGRLQIFNNWSPYLVKQKKYMWVGMEYFAFENDELWNQADNNIIQFARSELEKINLFKDLKIIDGTVKRVKKAYPAYFGTYKDFSQIKDYLDKLENLYCVGRNGQHKYNNMDHSMLSSIEAVKNIKLGIKDKANVWEVNTEKEYHEKT
jgi:protoporphyrinogen oxidase